MSFIDSQNRPHDTVQRLGVLLVNLGTPAAPTVAALRTYLRQFLSDRRVIEVPKWVWWFMLNFVILPRRSSRSAQAYQKIWQEQGSPLLIYSRDQQTKLQQRFSPRYPFVCVELGMSYGEPSIPQALQSLKRQGATKLLVIPLYPQYASSTVGSVFEAVNAELKRWRWIPELRFITSYHDRPQYITSIADAVRSFRKRYGKSRFLLFSFHGAPLISLMQGDPYYCQCQKTARLVAENLKLNSDEYQVCFQSRFGKQPWLQPYTDETLRSLPAKGIKDVQIICPGFASDCLETLEEIDGENRALFLKAGGEQFGYIPCLNAKPRQIGILAKLVGETCSDWFEPLKRMNATLEREQIKRLALAKKEALLGEVR